MRGGSSPDSHECNWSATKPIRSRAVRVHAGEPVDWKSGIVEDPNVSEYLSRRRIVVLTDSKKSKSRECSDYSNILG